MLERKEKPGKAGFQPFSLSDGAAVIGAAWGFVLKKADVRCRMSVSREKAVLPVGADDPVRPRVC